MKTQFVIRDSLSHFFSSKMLNFTLQSFFFKFLTFLCHRKINQFENSCPSYFGWLLCCCSCIYLTQVLRCSEIFFFSSRSSKFQQEHRATSVSTRLMQGKSSFYSLLSLSFSLSLSLTRTHTLSPFCLTITHSCSKRLSLFLILIR